MTIQYFQMSRASNHIGGKTEDEFADKFIAFGGGRNQCSARWFAKMETHIFISVLLYNFNIRLAEDLAPEPSSQHVFRVPQPAVFSPVTISRRKH